MALLKKDKKELKPVEKKEVAESSSEEYLLPDVDIVEKEKEFVLYADLPGVTKENLEVTIDEDKLVVIGKLPKEIEGDLKPYYKEFEWLPFKRVFSISNVIDKDNIKATLKDGVLILTLPKVEKLQPKKIEIK